MKNWPWYSNIIIGLVIAAVAYLFWFKPQQAEVKSLKTERVKIEATIEKLKTKKKELDKIQGEIEYLNQALRELENIIPKKREESEILRNVQQMAVDSALEVVEFKPEKEITKEFHSERPISVLVRGSFHNLGTLFDRIVHFPRIFNIDDFNIKALRTQTDSATISANFTAKTYFFLEESQVKKPAAEKAKKAPTPVRKK
jgi:type IV pilus assembly protein PilO